MNEHQLVGPYVVDALEEQESKDFEAHLAGCESCQCEVTEMSEALAQLSELTAVSPPPALRTSVLAAVQRERPTPWSSAAGGPASSSAPNGRPSENEYAPRQLPATPPVLNNQAQSLPDELALRRSRRAVRALLVGIAASLILAVGVGGWAQTVRVGADRQTEVASSQVSLWAAADLSVKHVTLDNGSTANYAISKQQNRAMFVAETMPALSQGEVFQMWTIRTKDGKPVARPSVTFGGDGPVTVMFDDLADAEQVAISVEPEGGSPDPTTTPFGAASL